MKRPAVWTAVVSYGVTGRSRPAKPVANEIQGGMAMEFSSAEFFEGHKGGAAECQAHA